MTVAHTENKAMLMNIAQTRLPNGIRIATSVIPHVQSVAIGIWVGAGARYETRATAGASHFIEHLLFKGTERLTARDISQGIEGRGGACNAFTQEELTCYYARSASNHTWETLRILGEMYRHPRFAPSDIDKERSVIIEEIMMYRDQPEQVVQEMLNEIMWKDHALGRPIIGFPETLREMDRARIMAFKKKKYVPGNTVFVFSGHVRHEECVRHVEQLTKGLRVTGEPAYRLVTKNTRQECCNFKSKDIAQAQMAMGFRIFGRFDKRRYAIKLLNVILGENMSSRLFQVVREKHGLAYAVHSGVQLFAETGALVITAGLEEKHQAKALELIMHELRRLKQQPVGGRELARAKEYVIGHLRLAMETPSGHMMWLGDHMLNYGKVPAPETVMEAMQKVGADEIQELAHTIFKHHVSSLALLTPKLTTQDNERLDALLAML